MLDYVIPYVNERAAFGEPISNRQAVAFAVADIAIEPAGMRLATYRAASRADHGESFAREAALARQLCAEKAMRIGSEGVQLLGGHGYIKEHPVERWYRDLRRGGRDGGRPARLSDCPGQRTALHHRSTVLETPDMIKFETPTAARARPTRWRPRSSGRSRASTTSPSTSTRRSSTCSPR